MRGLETMEPHTLIANLRRQHDDLIVMSEEFASTLDNRGKWKFEGISQFLSLFEGKLKIHLSMEDRVLYPRLVNHVNEDVRSMTKTYIEEMSGIFDTFHSFTLKWKEVASADDLEEDLLEEMKAIIDEILVRIGREEKALFPLLEEQADQGGG